MSQLPQISVVLPVFDGQPHLAESVESVLAQQGVEFDLLACDDGSRDGSLSWLRSRAREDPRLQVFHNQSNLGLFPTLNRLLREARAPLVRIWTQDDRMLPGCLDHEQELWRRLPSLGMSYCAYEVIDDAGVVRERVIDRGTPELIEPWLADQISLYWGCVTANISTVTLRREVALELGGFDPRFPFAGDFELWTRISACHALGYLPRALVQVRGHARQLSRRRDAFVSYQREHRLIFERLRERVPPVVAARSRAFEDRRQVLAVHHALRSLFRGRLREATEVYRELALDAGRLPLRSLARWLATGNGRWLRPVPLFLPPTDDQRRVGRGAATTDS